MGFISSLFGFLGGGDSSSSSDVAPVAPEIIKAPSTPTLDPTIKLKSDIETIATSNSLLSNLLSKRRAADVEKVNRARNKVLH
jgi:antitoxin component HigA of HigAB toxin-antitoxin module